MTTIRIFTFDNHPPIRKSVDDGVTTLYEVTDDIVCDTNPEWGHNWLGYIECKSGKRLYVSSYASGMEYSGRPSRTVRRVERDPLAWLREAGNAMYHRHAYKIDPSLIVDLDAV